MSRSGRRGVALVALGTLFAVPADADETLPPWNERGDLPVPVWARSVSPTKPEVAVYAEPGRLDARRGSLDPRARVPLFAARRADGCQGRWLNIGPSSWVCSDVAKFGADPPDPLGSALPGARPWRDAPGPRWGAAPLPPIAAAEGEDGLPYRYYFAGAEGAYGFSNLAQAADDAPEQELEPGFAVAIVETATAHGERWGKTKKGHWIAMRELSAARATAFHGELVSGELELAWVVADKAQVFASEKGGKATGTRVRFERLKVLEEKGAMLRVEGDAWIRAKDVSRPRLAPPPLEAGGDAATERWIDVDLASQSLVAYEGTRPVFATLVSTGRGPKGSELETKKGVFRIWVKLATTKMDNLALDDVDKHYAIEDVPWVQFFDKGIGLHGAFWHKDFGRVHSHGCVNLAPLDARWLFAFTGPHLPTGWTAALPTKLESGTAVRVR